MNIKNKKNKKRELINKAKEAMEFAYAPYSNFRVGAALLSKSGKIYKGANIENASYGACNCAERTAIFKAVSEGEREFDMLAIVSSSNEPTYPCGICRQVIAEFSQDLVILLEDFKENIIEYSIKDLLPKVFRL